MLENEIMENVTENLADSEIVTDVVETVANSNPVRGLVVKGLAAVGAFTISKVIVTKAVIPGAKWLYGQGEKAITALKVKHAKDVTGTADGSDIPEDVERTHPINKD